MVMFKRLTALLTKRRQRALCVLAVALAFAASMHDEAAAQDQQEMLMNARGPFKPSTAEQLGLPSLAKTVPGSPTAEVRIWVWHRGDRDDYLLRLWQTAGRTDGELLALSKDGSGVHSRGSLKAQDWRAILRDLEAHSVWTIPAPTYFALCVVDTNLVVESYRDGLYRQVKYPGVRHYPGDAEAIYNYVFALAAADPQIASIGNLTKLGCG